MNDDETPEAFFKRIIEGYPPFKLNDLQLNDASSKEELALKKHVDLEDQQALNDLNKLSRADKLNIHLHRVSVFLIYFVALMITTMVLVLVYHMVVPAKIRFLTSEEITKIYEFLFTGVSGGLMTSFTSKYVGQKKPKKDL